MSTFMQIEEADQRVIAAQEDYVKRFGWALTCNTPGSFWLWSRDFTSKDTERHARWKAAGPGPCGWPSEPQPWGRITAGIDLAVSMTRAVLDDEEPY